MQPLISSLPTAYTRFGRAMNFVLKISISLGAAMLFAVNPSCNASDLPRTAERDTGLGSESEALFDAGLECDPDDFSLIKAETSPAISTVGIVEWSTTVTPIADAFIEFGLDTHYGYRAPIDLNAVNYRTLLLGMKPSSVYHFRIVVNGCEGVDHTIQTGPQPTALPSKTVTVDAPASAAGGFIVTSSGMTRNYAYILDRDGDFVWWYPFEAEGGKLDGIGRAKMSPDGRFMWAGTINMACGCGALFRIPMDGLGTQETMAVNMHHDFTVLPDNTVTTIEYVDDANTGDKIVEHSESGEIRTVYNLSDDFLGSGYDWSHCNALHYYPRDDSYSVSCDNLNNILKIDRSSGTLVWVLEGDEGGDFSGASWERQHGHQLLENGDVLVFSNNGEPLIGDNEAAAAVAGVADGAFVVLSEVLEFSLDLDAKSALKIWSYKSETSSFVLGDVQRLEGGNTLVTYSAAGKIHEVTPSGNRVRSISVDALGYADWRPTLYGEPYRY